MINILYIGNNLRNKKSNTSAIQVLGGLLEQEGYTVYFASGKVSKVMRLLDMVYTFFKSVNRVDYVLIDTYSTSNFYYALIISQLSRLFRVQYIPVLHGGNLPARLKGHPYMSGLIFNNSIKNVAPSLFLKHAFEKYGYSNLVFIPNTIQIKNYELAQKSFKNIKLLWVRSFSNIYNPVMAIQVLKELIDKGYTAELCMVGPDSDGSLMRVKSLTSQLNVPVTFTGKLPKEEWIDLAADYNIFINTTNFDNMPVSVIEAMALGLPVVSTNVGGIPNLIEDGKTGLLVDKNDTAAMTSQIIRLSKNPELAIELSLNARKKVEPFDWKIVRKKWIQLLN